jgi:hypothetical protein
MAKIRCPKCGYTESDGRPHDRETYPEVCIQCEAKEKREADEGPTGVAAFYSARQS